MSDYLNRRNRERELEKIRGKRRNRNGNGNVAGVGGLTITAEEAKDANTAENLFLFAINTGELYPARRAIEKTLGGYYRRGSYTRELGIKRFDTFMRKVARQYAREFRTGPGIRGYGPFTDQAIKGAAKLHAERFEAEAALGNY